MSVVQPEPIESNYSSQSAQQEQHKMSQSEIKVTTSNLPWAQENPCEQVVIGFGFPSDWLRKWCIVFF